MARPRKGTKEKALELTQRLCFLIKMQSGLNERQIEELFGFGAVPDASKSTANRTGRSFNRYLKGERAMSTDMIQTIAQKAIKQPWWKLPVSLDGLTGNGMFTSAEMVPMLGDMRSGKRLTETLNQMQQARKTFQREQSRLLSSIQAFQTALDEVSALKFAMIGRSEVEGDESIFIEIESDNFDYDLRRMEEKLGEYRVEFAYAVGSLLPQE